MKYFIDTEFLEGTQKKSFLGVGYGKTKPTIDLISIGIVSEDNREYYAISKDFNLKEAWNRFDLKKDFSKPQGLGDKKVHWIRDNVLKPIFDDWVQENLSIYDDWSFTQKNFKKLLNKYGKTNKQIAEEIKEFVGFPNYYPKSTKLIGTNTKPEFYAYYADYDWVVFCWLFGKMIDLPKGFLMYCIDLKQMLDKKAYKYVDGNLKESIVSSDQHSNYCVNELKSHKNYPKQTNEHNALADARWNKELYKFLNNLQ